MPAGEDAGRPRTTGREYTALGSSGVESFVAAATVLLATGALSGKSATSFSAGGICAPSTLLAEKNGAGGADARNSGRGAGAGTAATDIGAVEVAAGTFFGTGAWPGKSSTTAKAAGVVEEAGSRRCAAAISFSERCVYQPSERKDSANTCALAGG